MFSPPSFNSSPPRSPRKLAIETTEPRFMFAADPILAAETPAADVLPLDVVPLGEGIPAPLATFSSIAATDTRGLTGAGQTVVVIDSGIAWDHTAFGGGIGPGKHIVGGWDFAENDADPYDDGPMGTHGTHVAGIIGSLDPRYPGLAPGADIVALRVFDDQGQGDFPRIEAALRWVHENRFAFANPITTVNLSLGARWNADGAPQWAIIEDELAQLEADGIFIAVAAGNSFAKFDQQVGLAYPAASSHVVPVASVDADGSLSNFSQRSDRVIAAPGRNVMSTVPDYAGNFNYRADDFLTLSGTSMAAPHVAAASILVREAFARAGHTRVTQSDIYAVLRDNADVIYDAITGQSYRVLNLARAIDAVLPPQNGAPPPAPTNPPPTNPTPTNPTPTNPTPTNPTPVPDVADWGAVASNVFRGQSFAADAWRTVAATRSGVLTIEIVATAGQDGAFSLHDASGNLLATAAATSSGLRLDANVAAGTSYRIHFAGVASAVDVRITNLVRIDNTGIYVFGAAGNDSVEFAASSHHELVVNGARYEFAASATRRVYLFGGEGHDTVSLLGTAGSDAAALRPGKVSLRTANVLVLARDFESATVDGRGGQDVAYFGDSQANESFTAWGDRAELVGDAARLRALGFESIRARSFGGHDTATLHAASAADQIARVGASTRLIGTNLLREVTGFQSVATFAAASLSTLSENPEPDSQRTNHSHTALGESLVDVSPAAVLRPLHSQTPAHDTVFRSVCRPADARSPFPADAHESAVDALADALVQSHASGGMRRKSVVSPASQAESAPLAEEAVDAAIADLATTPS